MKLRMDAGVGRSFMLSYQRNDMKAVGTKMKNRRLLAAIAFFSIAVLGITIFIFHPMRALSFDGADNDILVIKISDEVEIKDFSAFPVGNSVVVTVDSSKQEYFQICELFENLKYSHCFHTISAKWFSSNQSLDLIRLSIEGHDICLSRQSSHVMIDQKMYRISSENEIYQSIDRLLANL